MVGLDSDGSSKQRTYLSSISSPRHSLHERQGSNPVAFENVAPSVQGSHCVSEKSGDPHCPSTTGPHRLLSPSPGPQLLHAHVSSVSEVFRSESRPSGADTRVMLQPPIAASDMGQVGMLVSQPPSDCDEDWEVASVDDDDVEAIVGNELMAALSSLLTPSSSSILARYCSMSALCACAVAFAADKAVANSGSPPSFL